MKFIRCGNTSTYINAEMIEEIEIMPSEDSKLRFTIIVTLAGGKKMYHLGLFSSEAKAEEYLSEYLGISDEPVLV